MRLATHWLALALAATTAASPLVDVVRTTVQADDSRAKLDQGIVSVRLSLRQPPLRLDVALSTRCAVLCCS